MEVADGSVHLLDDACTRRLSLLDARILVELAAGKERKEIAAALHMSTAAVGYHITKIGKVLNVRRQSALVAAAMVAGILHTTKWPVVATGMLCVRGALGDFSCEA